MKNIAALQDLRGIAVIFVLLFHLDGVFGYSFFQNGSNGVLLFFMISGFIISFKHSNDRGIKSAILFSKKRANRIYVPYIPIFIVFYVLIIANGKDVYPYNDFLQVVRNLFLIQAPYSSIHPYAWSLVFEIFYYASFCVIVIIFRVPAIVFALLISLLPILNSVYNYSSTPNNLLFSMYNLYFALGVVLGSFNHLTVFKLNQLIIFFIVLLFLCIPSFYQYIWVKDLILLCLCFILVKSFIDSWNSISLLNSIGNSSYSIYLTHALTLSISKHVFNLTTAFDYILLFSVAVLLGIIYSKFFEIKITAKFNELFIKAK